MLVLVDWKKTVGEIADLLNRRKPPHYQSVDETLRAVARRSGWEDSDNQDENPGVAARA